VENRLLIPHSTTAHAFGECAAVDLTYGFRGKKWWNPCIENNDFLWISSLIKAYFKTASFPQILTSESVMSETMNHVPKLIIQPSQSAERNISVQQRGKPKIWGHGPLFPPRGYACVLPPCCQNQ